MNGLWVAESYNPRLKKRCQFYTPKCKGVAKYIVGQCDPGDMGQYEHLPGLYEVCTEHLAAAVNNALQINEIAK